MNKNCCCVETQDNEVIVDALTNAVVLKGFSPYVGANGNWYVYDNATKQFIDTGIKAKGEDYVLTDEDKIEIANLTTQRIQPALNKKMEYYKVVVHGNTIYHDDEVMTFNKLVELYNDISVFLYMEVSHLTLIPNSLVDDMLTFGTAYFNTTDSHIYQVDIDSNNNVVFHFNSLEVETNKIQAINNRNKNNEKYYPSNKAMTTYVDTEVAKATPSDYEQVKDDIALLKWKTLNLATEVVDSQEAYSKSVPTNVYEKALLNKLGGKSVVVNQLVKKEELDASAVVQKIGDEFIIDGNIVQNQLAVFNKSNTIYLHQNHKYLFIDEIKSNYNTRAIQINITGSWDIVRTTASDTYKKYMLIATSNTSGYAPYQNIRFNQSEENKDGAYSSLKGIRIVDLTQEFGVGNEPTSTDDIRIKLIDKYLEANPNYDEGTIKSANVESVVSKGANLLKLSGRTRAIEGSFDNSTPRTFNENEYMVGITVNNYWEKSNIASFSINDEELVVESKTSGYGIGFPIKVEPNAQYTISQETNGVIAYSFYDSNGYYISYTSNATFTTPSNCAWVNVVFRPSGEYTYKNIKLEKGSVATPYTPYREPITKPIASIINKYFPNGMKSAGSVYDEFDLVRGVAIKRIDSVDLGSLIWSYTSSVYGNLRSAGINDLININDYNLSHNDNLLSSIYMAITRSKSTGNENFSTWIDTSLAQNKLVIKDTRYDNAVSFKNDNVGNYLYFQLGSPTETPLDQADWEYLQSLEVESNGTITFENAEMLSVPNEESYLKRV